LERNQEDVSGKKAIVPLHKTRNNSIGARADGGALPTAGAQGYETAEYNCKYNYGRIQVSGPTIAASKTNKTAFVKVVDSEIKGCLKDLQNDVNRQMHGDGTGVLGLVNGDPATGTTLTMDTPNCMYISAGMKIDVSDPANGTPRAGSTAIVVTAKASATTLTVPACNAAIVDDDIVTITGNYLTEMMGLKGIVSDAEAGYGLITGVLSVGGIDRTTAGNEFWKAQVLSNSGTARKLSTALMQESIDKAEEEGGVISLILTSRVQRRKYFEMLKADARFVNNLTLDGGFKAIEYDGIPLVVDRHCAPGVIYFIDETTLALYEMSDIDWMDEDGAILHLVTGYDAYEAVLTYYATLGANNCNKNAILKDLILS